MKFKQKEKCNMTINSEKVLNFLKEHYGQEFSKQDISKALGISLSAVIGSINPLEKNKYTKITRTEIVELEPATETRKAKTKEVKYHTLTEAGLAYDPVAEEAAKAAAKQADKERKAAEKAAAKAAKEAEAEF
jgi:Mn-dependent DtxR family transcriptional regulator